jgi:hypothetical protein
MLFAVCNATGVEIEGSTQDLRELSRKVRRCSDLCEIAVSAPADYDNRGLRYVKRLVLTVGSGPLSITASDQQVSFSGSKDKLDLLAENIDSLVDPNNVENAQKTRDHLHVEFYPGHFFLSEDALPLILIRQD